MTDQIKKSLQFVTKYYTPGLLHPDPSFIRKSLPFWKRYAVAASVIGTALVAAAAVTTYVVMKTPDTNSTPQEAEEIITTPEATLQDTPKAEDLQTEEVKKMQFEDAELSEVVKAIEKEYGVKVIGEISGQPHLTLSYQGTAEELVATINELLDTNLTIER